MTSICKLQSNQKTHQKNHYTTLHNNPPREKYNQNPKSPSNLHNTKIRSNNRADTEVHMTRARIENKTRPSSFSFRNQPTLATSLTGTIITRKTIEAEFIGRSRLSVYRQSGN